MALEILGNIKLQGGLSLSSIYGRTRFNLNVDGDKVFIETDYYPTIEEYNNKTAPLQLDYYYNTQFDYDRTTDGVDLLLFSNQKIKEQLENEGLSVVITDL